MFLGKSVLTKSQRITKLISKLISLSKIDKQNKKISVMKTMISSVKYV